MPDTKPNAPGAAPEYWPLIGDIPEGERPRERLQRYGAAVLSLRELLAILLANGPQGAGVLAMADDLIKRFGSVSGLARASIHDLRRVRGIGLVKAVQLKAAFEVGRRIAAAPDTEQLPITSPAQAAQLVMLDMGLLEQEEVWTLLLDQRNRVIEIKHLYRGTLNSAHIRVAELFRAAIHANARAVIVAHNHPSGDPAPSAEDVRVTREMVRAGRLLELEVLDHLVIAHNRYVSLKERGMGFD